MTTTSSSRELSKLASQASAAMSRVENSVKDEPTPGHEINAYGSYYRVTALAKALALADEAIQHAPSDAALIYLKAGFLAWAGRFQEAATLYESIIGGSEIARHAMTQLAWVYVRLNRIADAQRIVDRHNAVLVANPLPGIPALSLQRLGLS
jgi:tetratricopeptide (TPR) repeat protein